MNEFDEAKGIQGIKKSEFAAATPEKVFGQDVRIEELPNGVRLYLKEKAIDLQTKKILVNVYRLVDDGGLKNKKVWVGKFVNRRPDEDEIADHFGGGSFIWIMKWLSLEGQERGIISEPIEIDDDFGRAAHEIFSRKRGEFKAESAPVAPVAANPAGGMAFDALTLIKFMEVAEEKTLARFERMAQIFAGNKSDSPAEVLAGAYKGASEMMKQAVETNLAMAKSVNKVNTTAMNAAPVPLPEEADGEGEGDSPEMPAWLAPFFPHIKAGFEKLIGGGPTGSLVRELIITSDEWKTIFGDKEKFGQAVEAMKNEFGEEKTKRALDILLSRREPKKTRK